jgi:NADPH-dependent curcumin reductase CurA
MHRVPEALEWLFGAWKSDQLFFREHLIHGIEYFPDAFEMLFSGQNHGKLLLKVN